MTDTVLITGASQGTGKATALLFARHGYDVILAARQPERLKQLAAVRAENRQDLAVPTDTSDVQQVEVLTGVINSNFLERAIFRGQDAAEVEERRKQIQAMIQAPWVSPSEDIADAIWSAVREGKSEAIVGQPMTATEALQVAV